MSPPNTAPSAEATAHPPTTELPPVTVVPARAATGTPPPPASGSTPPASGPTQERAGEFWRRFNLVLGGGINFGTRTYMNSPVYERAAPHYGTPGGTFFFQPSYSVYLDEKFGVRLGGELGVHSMGREETPGAPGSSLTAVSLAPMVGASWTPHPFASIDFNLSLGYMGLISSNADVGAPFSATLDWGDQGGFYLGLQGCFSTWNQAVGLCYSLSTMPGGYSLPTVPSDPRAASSFDPIHAIILNVNATRFIGNLAGARWF